MLNNSFVWRGTYFRQMRLVNLNVPKGVRLYLWRGDARDTSLWANREIYLTDGAYIDPGEAKKWNFPFAPIIVLNKDSLDRSRDWFGVIFV